MEVIGIIAEYNPFHTGHAHQISESRKLLGQDCAVVTVMSGCWIQQADCAVADKWTRARLALQGGADLVLELPTPWATASAERFAQGAVSILESTGVVTALSFGSECGCAQNLEQVAKLLDREEYRGHLAEQLDRGLSFPAARQEAIRQLDPSLSSLLDGANNTLGIEYIRALHALESRIRPVTIPRQGAAHNSLVDRNSVPFVSATQLRLALRSGNLEDATPFLLPGELELIQASGGPSRLSLVERAMLARLRTMSVEDWAKLPDSGQAEGLPCRLERAAAQATSLEEFFTLAKTKRYTHARLRRLTLWAWLGLTTEDFPAEPLYLRVLGFNDTGRELLKQMKKKATLPVLTKPAHARALDTAGEKLFRIEARCTDLYDLCLEQIPAPGREWTTGPVILLP